MTNEEKILQLLEQQGAMMDKHNTLLEQHGAMMEKHSTLLEQITTDVSDLKSRVVNLELVQENSILPTLQLLAEGQKTILETLAPKNRVEALEDEVALMKSVIKVLSQDLAELKKAQ